MRADFRHSTGHTYMYYPSKSHSVVAEQRPTSQPPLLWGTPTLCLPPHRSESTFAKHRFQLSSDPHTLGLHWTVTTSILTVGLGGTRTLTPKLGSERLIRYANPPRPVVKCVPGDGNKREPEMD